MAYHQQNPEAAWAAYVGLGRSDPVLLGIDDEAKNRQMDHIMGRIGEVVSGIPGNTLAPDVERDLRVIILGWMSFTFEVCRQRIIDPTTNAERLADAWRTAAGHDHPGAGDSRRAGRRGDGDRASSTDIVAILNCSLSVPVGTMVR